MKKFIALVLAVVFVAAVFAGCGNASTASSQPAASSSNTTSNAPASSGTEAAAPTGSAPFKVAYLGVPADPMTQAMFNASAAVIEAAGGELIAVESGMDGDAVIAAIESAISSGVKGVIFTPSADSMLPTIAKICEEAGVYFAISFRSINDPEVKEIVEACPYYAGNTVENEYNAGYYVANLMAEKGLKKVAFISIKKGDTTAEAREAGMRDAFSAAGVEIVGELREPPQASDAAAAVESWMATIDGFDGIMLVSNYTSGVYEALEDVIISNNKAGQVYLGSCDFANNMKSSFENNVVVALCGGHTIPDRAFCAVILANAIIGTPLDPNGPCTVVCPFLYLQTAEEAEVFQNQALNGEPLYYVDEVKEMLLGKTLEEVQAVADQYSMADLAARHGG